VVALGSLELLALTAPAAVGRVCAALDASKESVYAAVYDRRGDAVREIVAPRLVTRAELGEFLLESGAIDCLVRCESEGEVVIDAAVRTLLVTPMRARRLAEVAQLRFASGLATRADAVMPLYVGASAARPNQNKVVVPRANE
jgi:tRNA A37 threonylcarbamoyladenosine modification protein TsaB